MQSGQALAVFCTIQPGRAHPILADFFTKRRKKVAKVAMF